MCPQNANGERQKSRLIVNTADTDTETDRHSGNAGQRKNSRLQANIGETDRQTAKGGPDHEKLTTRMHVNFDDSESQVEHQHSRDRKRSHVSTRKAGRSAVCEHWNDRQADSE